MKMLNTLIELAELILANLKNNNYKHKNQAIMLKAVEFEASEALIYWARYKVNFCYILRVETINDNGSIGFDESELTMISPKIIKYTPFKGGKWISRKKFVKWTKILSIKFDDDKSHSDMNQEE